MRSKAFRVGGNGKCDEGKGIKQLKEEKKNQEEAHVPIFKKENAFIVGCFQHPQALTILWKAKHGLKWKGVRCEGEAHAPTKGNFHMCEVSNKN
jgi:hypothetical protein